MKDKDASTKAVEGDANGVDQSLIGTGDGVTEAAQEIMTFVEQMPEFEGGEDARQAFLGRNLQYPPLARENGIEGKVVVKFVVGGDGKISQVEALTHKGWGLEEEAIRVAKMMPGWKAGKQNGKAVPVWFTMPITFKLSN